MTIKELILAENTGTNEEWITFTDVESLIRKYTKMKCKELLEIVVEKAKIYDSKYDGFHVDKNSILNAIDLETFC